jgi:capsular polysaccharide export protein
MDVRSYLLPPGARFIHGNLARFYPGASCVICINSTAGFEAAIHGKPVICFGSSFYTSDAHISRTTRERFEEDLLKAVRRRDDPEAGAALKAAVLNQYQVPGDVWAYTEEDLRATVGILLQHLEGVERRASFPASLAQSATKPSVVEVRRRRAGGAGARDRAVS